MRAANKNKKLYEEFIDNLAQVDAMLFLAAGNDGLTGGTLADILPHAVVKKKDDNVLIVGGVHMNGTLYIGTTPPGNSGVSIDIWAPATGVDVMLRNGQVVMNYDYGGTSIATALAVSLARPHCACVANISHNQQAGTAAWFLSLDDCEASNLDINRDDFIKDGAVDVKGLKDLIVSKSSYQRSKVVLGADQPHPTYPLPSKLNAIYNLMGGLPP